MYATAPEIDANPTVYLGIYDSSDSDETENISIKYLGERVMYRRFEAGLSEEKILYVLEHESEPYDYIWFCSDRKVPRLPRLLQLMEEDLEGGVDLIILSDVGIKGLSRTIRDY